MVKFLFRAFIGLTFFPQSLMAMTAQEVIQKVDANQSFNSEKFMAQMTVHKMGRTLTKTFNGYGMKAGQRFFMAFTNPEDLGVKYLKLNNELWIYLPDAQDILKISGHMLSQGMMGSDLSYEDMLHSETLLDDYSATLSGMTNAHGKECYHVTLAAKKSDVTYYRRDCLIDSVNFVIMDLDLYAKSGRLLKTMSFSDFTSQNGRLLAKKFTVKDETRKNSETVIEFKEIAFDIQLPGDSFSKSRLGR